MPSYDETIAALDKCYEGIRDIKKSLQELLNSENLPKAAKDEIQAGIEKQLKKLEDSKKTELEKLITYPPYMIRHFDKLQAFESDGASFEKSVFIITKFPNTDNPTEKDKELIKVIELVKNAILAKGFTPRIALDDFKYQAALWDNVEMYLLGCKRAVAIVESKYQQELNPNVTMEWGWMRGTNRDILYLMEKDFDKTRADILGLIEDRFEWANPEQGITKAVNKWLK